MSSVTRSLVIEQSRKIIYRTNTRPKIHERLVQVFVTDNWAVINKKNESLKICRRLKVSNSLGTFISVM